jgi:hypothetical protein
MNFGRKMIDAVGDLDPGDSDASEFVEGSAALFAHALAMLPETERKCWLQAIEEGELRRSVERNRQALSRKGMSYVNYSYRH